MSATVQPVLLLREEIMKQSKIFEPASMHRVVPAGEYGLAKILHDQPDAFQKLRAAMKGQAIGDGIYTRLVVDGSLWMTDTEFEWRTNLEAVSNLHGDVLIAGLGIGFIVQPLLKRSDVTSVTVIEKSADVIALVAPHLQGATVIEADIHTWEPPRKSFDSIYFDIWANIPNEDNREEIKGLKRRYRTALRPGGWMAAWCEDRASRRR